MSHNVNHEPELRMYKDLDVLRSPTIKNSVYFVYSSATQEVTQIWVTTNQNIPRPVALGTVTNITSPDGSIDITTLPTETQIQIQASILATINSALQPGDNVSELVNDGDGVNPYLTQDAFETLLGSLLREEFEYAGSQTFTTANDYAQVYSVEVTGVGALHSSQYTLTPPNQITINDALEIGDFVVVLYTQDNVSSLTYYTQAQTDNLLLTKEDVANKQDSLALDGTGSKYPTVDAINEALSTISVSDATTTSKGVIQLAGDLSGTASLPTVPALATKQVTLVSGTNIKTLEGQSLLGSGNIDLTKTDVGLSNVDNTNDLSKPVSTATQTVLNLKENLSNKTVNFSVINDTLYPTVKATEDRINSKVPTDYSKVVYVNTTSPTTATIFDLNNPPITNDNTLKNNVSNLYIGTDASTWVYITSPAGYVTKIITASTSNFYLSGTTTDAGSSKTGSISRTGNVAIGSNSSFVDKLTVVGNSTTTGNALNLQDSAGNQLIGFGNNKTFFIPQKTIFLFDRTGSNLVADSPRIRFQGGNITAQEIYADQGYIAFTQGIQASGNLTFSGSNRNINFNAGTNPQIVTRSGVINLAFSELIRDDITRLPTTTFGATSSVITSITGISGNLYTPFNILHIADTETGSSLRIGVVGVNIRQTLHARVNGEYQIAQLIKPTYTDNGFTGLTKIAHYLDLTQGFGYYQKGTSVVNFFEGSNGLGTTTPQGKLDVVSNTQGSLPFPRMTSAQRAAISSPTVGLHVYQTDGTEGVYVNKSTGWQFAY